MAISSFKGGSELQLLSSWGGLLGPPPLVWPPSFKTVLGPHKEFGPKLGAVILENLGSKTCILQVLAVFGFKMFLFKLPSGHFELPHGHL